ncbi:MAG: CRISPR-associated RAMP protein Csx10 [Herpetosiphonaceae bacterium]|nr:MAG: CRISPR-associated RAMP protein Csx10 [Herpetosiphonaceae bacterium]
MKAICYHLQLKQPLLATALLGDPNSAVSFNYVPGSLIRGMLIQRFLSQNPTRDLAGDPLGRRLFFSGQTRYLHAYLMADDARRSLPTPRSFFAAKSLQLSEQQSGLLGRPQTARVYDWSHPDTTFETRRENEAEEKDVLKPLAYPFAVIKGNTLSLYAPQYVVKVHVQRDRVKGRSTTDSGAVFRYEALAPDQFFAGAILVDEDSDAEILCHLLAEEHCWLGRSRSANYGRVRISALEVLSSWREAGGSAPTLPAGESCTLTLLSDTLLRDAEGNPVVAIDDAVLSAYLGLPVVVHTSRSFTDVVIHGGFNRTWQLPLPQSYALAAGSVIAFTPQQAIDSATVERLEQAGLGERRVEGFGRVAFTQQGERILLASLSPSYVERTPPAKLSSLEQRIAQTMFERLLEERINQAILHFVHDQIIISSLGYLPETSQLSRVGVLVRRALHSGDVQSVRTAFARFKPTAARQFERASIENQPLREWIEDLLNTPEKVWNKFHDFKFPQVPGNNQSELVERTKQDQELARRTALRLLAAVLAALEDKRKESVS